MPENLTKAQINKLGERLRSGEHSDADLTRLDEYRRSFHAAYERVRAVIRDRLRLEVTGRPAKTTTSIIAKLQREKTRLSKMQDIAGCRVIVDDIREQDRVVRSLCEAFPQANVIDRREHTSHGYRAVHVIIEDDGKVVEVQVRTKLQHLWAETSEKASDLIDPQIKYGAGGEAWVKRLEVASELIGKVEQGERLVRQMRGQRAAQASGQVRRLKRELLRIHSELLMRLAAIEKADS